MDATLEQGSYILRPKSHHSEVMNVLNEQRKRNCKGLCDVTLAVEGTFTVAHKAVLAACSQYFQQHFEENVGLTANCNITKTTRFDNDKLALSSFSGKESYSPPIKRRKAHSESYPDNISLMSSPISPQSTKTPPPPRSQPKPHKISLPSHMQHEEIVLLPGIKAKTLSQLLDYMYSSSLLINKENVQDLLLASCLLQVPPVLDACIKILTKETKWKITSPRARHVRKTSSRAISSSACTVASSNESQNLLTSPLTTENKEPLQASLESKQSSQAFRNCPNNKNDSADDNTEPANRRSPLKDNKALPLISKNEIKLEKMSIQSVQEEVVKPEKSSNKIACNMMMSKYSSEQNQNVTFDGIKLKKQTSNHANSKENQDQDHPWKNKVNPGDHQQKDYISHSKNKSSKDDKHLLRCSRTSVASHTSQADTELQVALDLRKKSSKSQISDDISKKRPQKLVAETSVTAKDPIQKREKQPTSFTQTHYPILKNRDSVSEKSSSENFKFPLRSFGDFPPLKYLPNSEIFLGTLPPLYNFYPANILHLHPSALASGHSYSDLLLNSNPFLEPNRGFNFVNDLITSPLTNKCVNSSPGSQPFSINEVKRFAIEPFKEAAFQPWLFATDQHHRRTAELKQTSSVESSQLLKKNEGSFDLHSQAIDLLSFDKLAQASVNSYAAALLPNASGAQQAIEHSDIVAGYKHLRKRKLMSAISNDLEFRANSIDEFPPKSSPEPSRTTSVSSNHHFERQHVDNRNTNASRQQQCVM